MLTQYSPTRGNITIHACEDFVLKNHQKEIYKLTKKEQRKKSREELFPEILLTARTAYEQWLHPGSSLWVLDTECCRSALAFVWSNLCSQVSKQTYSCLQKVVLWNSEVHHKELLHIPAAKLYFCPGSHHTICQSARYLLLGLPPNPAGISAKPKLWKIQLWSYKNFIFRILHRSVSSGAVGMAVFSGNVLLLGRRLTCIAWQEFWFCSFSSSSTSPCKIQNNSEEINSVYDAHGKSTKCLCAALGWNQSFMKWKLGQQSLTSGQMSFHHLKGVLHQGRSY